MAMEVYRRCADCEGPSSAADEPLVHDDTCPRATVPEQVTDAEIVAAAHEMARLYRRSASSPWYRSMLRLVVMCEHAEAAQ